MGSCALHGGCGTASWERGAVTDAVIIAIVKYAEVKEVFGMEVISTGRYFLLVGKQARDNDLRSGEISGTKSSRGGCTYRMVLK